MRRSIFAICVLMSCLSATASAQRWDAAVNIGSGWNNQDLVFDAAGNAYLAWAGLNFSRSTDNGRSWSPPRWIGDSGPGWRGNPDLAIDSSGRLYAVVEFKPDGAEVFQLYFTRSDDAGETWSALERISDTPKHTAWPKLEVDSRDRVHVLWQDKCNLHNWSDPPLPGCVTEEYYHLISTDRGSSWSPQHLVASAQGGGWTIHSAVDSAGAVYGLWSFWPGPGQPGGLYLYKSVDGGVTWAGRFLDQGGEAAISIDSRDTVHVVYAQSTEPSARAFLYRSGENGGASWSSPRQLGLGSGQSGYNPAAWCSVAADRSSGNLLAAWQDGSSGNFEVYVSRSPNRGRQWQRPENVSANPAPSLQPEIFFDRDSVAHLVWNDEAPMFEVYYRRGALRGR